MENSFAVSRASCRRAAAAAAIVAFATGPTLAGTNFALQDALPAFTLPEGLMASLLLLLVGVLVARRLLDRAAARRERIVAVETPDLRWWRKPMEPGDY